MKDLFLEHPRSVGETYLEHLGTALSFSGALIVAGVACALHAVFPFLCRDTGSRAICDLHDRMVANRCSRHTKGAKAQASVSS